VAVKLFKDDFTLALKNNFQADIPLEKADEKLNSGIISKYINSCLQIEVDKSEILNLEYKNSEINEDAVWIYFNFKKTNNTHLLSIKNTLMLDLWEDQTNLLIINWKGKENGYKFNRNNIEVEIEQDK
jgi:hypothetical protein